MRSVLQPILSAVLTVAAGVAPTAVTASSPIDAADHARFVEIGEPQVSPDGDWLVYTVATPDFTTDRRNVDLWLVRWDGSDRRQLTVTGASERQPRWHPDSGAVSYLRPTAQGDTSAQLFVHDIDTPEPRQLTRLPGRITEHAWSPDGQRLALVYRAPEPTDTAGRDRPIAIDRYVFKRDGEGYLAETQRSRLHLYDVASGEVQPLIAGGDHEESRPAWAPDGRSIAYVSNHDATWDRSRNDDIFVVDAQPGSTPRQLTSTTRIEGSFIAWSPDSRLIAFGLGSEQKLAFHSQNTLAVVPAAGGDVRALTTDFDRGVSAAAFSADGRHLRFLVADDRDQTLAEVPVAGGVVRVLTPGHHSLTALTQNAAGRLAVVATGDTTPQEVHVLDGRRLRRISDHNRAAAATLPLQTARRIEFDSADGTRVHALLTLPPGHRAGDGPLPTILWIHGGPNAQDAHGFRFERQLFAAHGYAVLNVNYRGSSGRGIAFGQQIAAAWGQLDVQDILAAADHLVAAGIADPARIGLGGWSYGGLLTNFVIASDTRFRAAVSGAGSANNLALYGHNQYIHLYESQFGAPWENLDAWIAVSYPFLRADRIQTPTLFLGGDQDHNVPIIGSEQMYQALRALDVPTRLIVYPGQNHRITRIGFETDRYQRYLDWFGRYLAPQDATKETAAR